MTKNTKTGEKESKIQVNEQSGERQSEKCQEFETLAQRNVQVRVVRDARPPFPLHALHAGICYRLDTCSNSLLHVETVFRAQTCSMI
jgi:hypothetical protein